MRILKIVLRAGLVLIVVVAITEIMLRLTIANELQKWTTVQYQPDPVLGYRFKTNSQGVVTNAAFSRPYQINSQGFPGDEFSAKKTAGIYRIVIVGASDETGLFTNGPLNFINVAGALFKKNGYKVEVINLGVDGHGRGGRNVEFLKAGCAGYEPDLVLFRNLGWPLEDFMQYRTTYKDVLIKYTDTSQSNLDAAKGYIDDELSHKDTRLYLYDYSYIYRYMTNFYLGQYQKSKFWQSFGSFFFADPNKMECYARHLIFWPGYQYSPTKYSAEASIRILRNLQEILWRRKTRLVLFNTYYEEEASSIRLFAQNHLTYLPLQVARKDEHSFGKYDGHTSQEGHKAIGTALFNALKDSIPQWMGRAVN